MKVFISGDGALKEGHAPSAHISHHLRSGPAVYLGQPQPPWRGDKAAVRAFAIHGSFHFLRVAT